VSREGLTVDRISKVRVANLACQRGGRVVFRDLSFAVEAGRLLAVEGANGAGKTSLLRMIAGFIAPLEGMIAFDDESEISDPEDRGKLIGWLGHQDAAKSQLTPHESLYFFAGLYGTTADADAALQAVGLKRVAELPCQYLSAGQKKRLALARLHMSGRPIWLLDEPLASLDAEGRGLVKSMIAAHCAGGGIAIAATHETIAEPYERLTLS
jgi:heme exporter protein A